MDRAYSNKKPQLPEPARGAIKAAAGAGWGGGNSCKIENCFTGPNPNLWRNIYWLARYRDGLPVSLSRCAKFGDFSFSLRTSGDAELRIPMP